MKVGVIATKNYQSKRKLQNFISNFRKVDNVTILGSGTDTLASSLIKKYTVDFGIDYAEYNPSFSGHNLYSAMPKHYYGKKYHFSQLIHSMNMLAIACTKLVIFANSQQELEKDIRAKTAFVKATKLQKPTIIIQ